MMRSVWKKQDFHNRNNQGSSIAASRENHREFSQPNSLPGAHQATDNTASASLLSPPFSLAQSPNEDEDNHNNQHTDFSTEAQINTNSTTFSGTLPLASLENQSNSTANNSNTMNLNSISGIAHQNNFENNFVESNMSAKFNIELVDPTSTFVHSNNNNNQPDNNKNNTNTMGEYTYQQDNGSLSVGQEFNFDLDMPLSPGLDSLAQQGHQPLPEFQPLNLGAPMLYQGAPAATPADNAAINNPAPQAAAVQQQPTSRPAPITLEPNRILEPGPLRHPDPSFRPYGVYQWYVMLADPSLLRYQSTTEIKEIREHVYQLAQQHSSSSSRDPATPIDGGPYTTADAQAVWRYCDAYIKRRAQLRNNNAARRSRQRKEAETRYWKGKALEYGCPDHEYEWDGHEVDLSSQAKKGGGGGGGGSSAAANPRAGRGRGSSSAKGQQPRQTRYQTRSQNRRAGNNAAVEGGGGARASDAMAAPVTQGAMVAVYGSPVQQHLQQANVVSPAAERGSTVEQGDVAWDSFIGYA